MNSGERTGHDIEAAIFAKARGKATYRVTYP
jgi:hypothetical protein